MSALWISLRRLWRFLREVSGEDDYARWCARAQARGDALPTPQAFYLDKIARKYRRPTRCC